MRFVANDAQKTTVLLRAINILTLIASILLLASLSVEILYSEQLARFTDIYSWAMFSVCIIFLIDFFALMLHSPHPWRFLLRNFIVLALSIPYHTLANAMGIEPNHTATIAMSSIVMLRSVMALYITMRWLISSRATRLLGAYIATVVVASYFGALLFYEYEAPVNNAVKGFGDAMWWAWMNLTTVGAEIFPVTAIGKVICVLLPVLGTAMFPVLTVYITSLYNRHVASSGTRVADDGDKPKNN
jgi:voltage-gated potassium channel